MVAWYEEATSMDEWEDFIKADTLNYELPEFWDALSEDNSLVRGYGVAAAAAIGAGVYSAAELNPVSKFVADCAIAIGLMAQLDRMEDSGLYTESEIEAKRQQFNEKLQSTTTGFAIDYAKSKVGGTLCNLTNVRVCDSIEMGEFIVGTTEANTPDALESKYLEISSLFTSEYAKTAIERAKIETLEVRKVALQNKVEVQQGLEQEIIEQSSLLINQLNENRQRNDEIQNELATVENDLAETLRLFQEVNDELDEIDEQLQDLQGDIALYQRALDNHERGWITLTPVQIAQYKQTIEDLIKEEDELQRSVRGKDGLLKTYNLAKEQLEELVGELGGDLENSQQLINLAQQQLTNLNQQKQELQADIFSLEEEQIPSLEIKLGNSKQKLNDLEIALSTSDSPFGILPDANNSPLPNNIIRLDTGYPVSIMQDFVFTDSLINEVSFDFLFGGETSSLSVTLDGVNLGDLNSNDFIATEFSFAKFDIDWLNIGFNGDPKQIKIELNGFNSFVFLDNFSITGLFEDNFDSGINGWSSSNTGSVSEQSRQVALQSVSVSEPLSIGIFLAGILGLLSFTRKLNR
jgi:hypothetical protein